MKKPVITVESLLGRLEALARTMEPIRFYPRGIDAHEMVSRQLARIRDNAEHLAAASQSQLAGFDGDIDLMSEICERELQEAARRGYPSAEASRLLEAHLAQETLRSSIHGLCDALPDTADGKAARLAAKFLMTTCQSDLVGDLPIKNFADLGERLGAAGDRLKNLQEHIQALVANVSPSVVYSEDAPGDGLVP